MSILLKMLRTRFVYVTASLCAAAVTAAVALWWNRRLGGMIDVVSAGAKLPEQAVILALVTAAVTGVTNFAKGYISALTCEYMTHDLRMGYARYFSALPYGEAENLSVGKQLSKLQNEIADISGYISGNLFQLLDDAVRFGATLVWLLIINPALTLTVFLPVFPVMAYVFYTSRIINAATERAQQAKGRMNGYAETLLSLFPVIRLYDAASMLCERYGGEVKVWERETGRSERTRARLMSPSALFTVIPLILLFRVGGGMALSGKLTIGTVYIFLNLSGNVSGVLMNMPGYIAAFRQFSANIKRVSPRVLMEGMASK